PGLAGPRLRAAALATVPSVVQRPGPAVGRSGDVAGCPPSCPRRPRPCLAIRAARCGTAAGDSGLRPLASAGELERWIAVPIAPKPHVTLEPRSMAHAGELFPVLAEAALYEFIDEEPPKSIEALRQKLARSES